MSDGVRREVISRENPLPNIIIAVGVAYVLANVALIGLTEFVQNQETLESMGYHRCDCPYENHECPNILTPLYPATTCIACVFGQCQRYLLS